MRMASGERLAVSRTTEDTMLVLVSNNSSRLIPGRRGTPDVITTMSESLVGS